MLGKVYHGLFHSLSWNLALENTSSGLKSTEGIGLLKPSGVHLHAATSLLRHSSRGPQQ